MRASAVLLGFLFGGIAFVYDVNAGASLGILVGFLGIIGGLATMLNPRYGTVVFFIAVGLAVIAAFSDGSAIVYAVMFLIPALLARRSDQRNRQASERAERHDRYIRQQLGE